jgi:subtilisin family serine protease
MRPIRVVVSVLCLALTPFAASAAIRSQPAYVDGEVLVKYRDRAGGAILAKSRGLEVKRSIPAMGVDLLKLPKMTTVPQAIAVLKADPSIAYAEPNFRRFRRAVTPNDPLFADQWGLRNTGQANFVSGGPAGTPGADMNLVQAWDANGDGVADRVGDPSVIVAVIDDGVLTTHEDLAANIVAGRDTRDDDNDPNPDDIDEDFHGTLVAGCIGAVGDNGIGVAGVAWKSKIMPLRFDYDAASEAQAIQFAIDHGAKIINASFGGPGASLLEGGRRRLANLADATGGRSFVLGSVAELAATYDAIEEDLRSQYLLVYQSDGQGEAFRSVEVEIRRAGVTARTMRGYIP